MSKNLEILTPVSVLEINQASFMEIKPLLESNLQPVVELPSPTGTELPIQLEKAQELKE